MNGTPGVGGRSRCRRSAIISACFSLSMAHGPPMRASGAPPPMVTRADPDRRASRLTRCRGLVVEAPP